MPRKPQSRGNCAYCGTEFAKAGAGRHLKKCPERLKAIQKAEESSRQKENIWHLRIQDAYAKDFWLDLEMRGSASLNKLDAYLRAIWLECCGHLSEFTIGGFGGNTIGKSRKADAVFQAGMKLDHLYDFGTTSETTIKVVDVRKGAAISKNPIELMARNHQPEANCSVCGKPANWLCIECLYEENEAGWFLCDEHAETHPHDDYGEPMSLHNSPRTGYCGYAGPAEPPY